MEKGNERRMECRECSERNGMGRKWPRLILSLYPAPFIHLIITSKPFNHQQWSQDGKRVKGADQTRPRVMMTGEGRWAASSLHAVSFPTDPFPFLSPFSRLVHALVLRSLRSLRMRAERVRRENAKRDGMGTRNQEWDTRIGTRPPVDRWKAGAVTIGDNKTAGFFVHKFSLLLSLSITWAGILYDKP